VTRDKGQGTRDEENKAGDFNKEQEERIYTEVRIRIATTIY
jgi:hypothetical protein